MLAKTDGLSLRQHIEDLLCVSHGLECAFPILQAYFDDIDFWSHLRQAIIFHDLGKTTKGFQSFMQDNKPYRFRHEIMSAVIAKNYTDNEPIINAILAHHKSFGKLKELLNEYENNKKYNQDR